MSRPPAPQFRNSSYRREARFPLDPSHCLQRPLTDDAAQPLPVVRLKSSTRHPTVFRKRIADVDPRAKHGDLVRVITEANEPVGFGLWNPRAEATVRILSFHESPAADNWWQTRFAQSVELRQDRLRLGNTTNAYRLLNAEGDHLPGLVADRFDNIISIEAFTLAMFQRGEAIGKLLAEVAGVPHWVVRPGPSTLEQEGFSAEGFSSGSVPKKVTITEHGIQYEIQPFAGQKTGFFCDQRDNRLRLRDFCAGKSVLDLCSYAGGFALNALKGGASEVTAVDLDEEAVKLARRNAQLNKASIKFVHADAFAYLRDMQRNERQFDVIILDPPKLIRNRDEAGEGQNKYFDLNKLAGTLVKRGGILLTCSCSGLFSMDEFFRTTRAAVTERQPRLLLRSGAAPDHPVSLACPETEYLKCLWLQMEN
ncbi:class I SAM-dependent rRNA methyltransferase [Planctomicrobium sp. SH664]|uniref:class I SAM-dependent rRNA methyltransferase n=1 Tax=Planctomicrobium sp. SH664 TaxID=3448125 RepID=UPI003F5AF6CE